METVSKQKNSETEKWKQKNKNKKQELGKKEASEQ